MKIKAYLVTLIFLVMTLLISFVAAGCAGTTSSTTAPSTTTATSTPVQAVTIKFASALPPVDPVVTKAQELAERFKNRVNGRYIIEVYAGGTLATMEEEMEMLRTGAIQMAEFPIEYLSGSDIRFSAVTLPFLINSLEANVEFLKNINESLFGDILAEKFNAKPLVAWTTGIHEYCGAKKPVKTLEDWKGLLIWVANPAEAQTAEAFGASPVSLPFFDGYPALQKGTVDAGVGLNPTGVWNFKWYDAIRYITIANTFGTSGYFDINLDTWNSMPKDVQNVLLDECQRAENELKTFFSQYAKDAISNLEKEGVQVYRLPEAERAKWIEASKPVLGKFYEQIGAADAQKIKDAASKANQ
jgi:TRAP-type C4-dicarboxylate transport system substrate-binding protein